MNLEILSPEKSLFSGTALSVTLPGESGSFSVLDHHSPLMSTLDKGEIIIDSGKLKISIQRGVVEVLNNKVRVLVQD